MSGGSTAGSVCNGLMEPAEILTKLTYDVANGQLDAFCADLGVDPLVLFGSARRDVSNANDVDIAYSFESRTPALSHLDVVNAFGERYGDGLDVMPLDQADPVARTEALGRGEVLVERTPEKFAELQLLAFGEFEDTRRMRRRVLEVLMR